MKRERGIQEFVPDNAEFYHIGSKRITYPIICRFGERGAGEILAVPWQVLIPDAKGNSGDRSKQMKRSGLLLYNCRPSKVFKELTVLSGKSLKLGINDGSYTCINADGEKNGKAGVVWDQSNQIPIVHSLEKSPLQIKDINPIGSSGVILGERSPWTMFRLDRQPVELILGNKSFLLTKDEERSQIRFVDSTGRISLNNDTGFGRLLIGKHPKVNTVVAPPSAEGIGDVQAIITTVGDVVTISNTSLEYPVKVGRYIP